MRRDRLKDVPLYLIAGAEQAVVPVEAFLDRVIGAGVRMVQLRERSLGDRDLLAVARRFADVCRRRGALFIVNDRTDIALLAGADGVHVGQDDLKPAEVRAVAGDDFIVGLSTHSPAQIDDANGRDADYIGVGPVFATPTKPSAKAVGLELVRYAAAHARAPFFAIGGIDSRTASVVCAAGARAVSVLRAVTGSEMPEDAVKAILGAMAPAARPPGAR
jgi:thiamine-phosphate pyrophosphorylase